MHSAVRSAAQQQQHTQTHTHTHTFILLHGRDSTGKDFRAEFLESETSGSRTLPSIFPSVRWVFPSSQLLHSARFDAPLTQWFDMWATESPNERCDEQVEQLAKAVGDVVEIVQREMAVLGDGDGKILLGGISQGAATALAALMVLGERQELRGRVSAFVGFSSWFPEAVRQVVSTHALSSDSIERDAREMQVLLQHCRDDGVIDVKYGRQLRDVLVGMGMEVTWSEYPGDGHWVNEPRGIDELVAFLGTVLHLPAHE
ncbi:acyl-protein thioesterase [Polychaeton citri CBS 116435]|uniref:Acyl-protein thioesterase n=1 Tax=Polychaeton citri CBS 116435 TaxID=1314669 RepID=A0A9P4QIA9_9PEZI|nr:acyl-protein thioesterase [Polychaeton citri CBS 116435]